MLPVVYDVLASSEADPGGQGKLPRASGCKGASGSRKYYSYNWGVEGIIIKCDASAADPEGGGGGGGGGG